MISTKLTAIAHARDSLDQLGLPADLPTLHHYNVALRREQIGGSHSVVTYPPLDALEAMTSPVVIKTGDHAHLYIHIPFCETQCTFCPYVVQHYGGEEAHNHSRDGEVITYLELLGQEIQNGARAMREHNTSVRSLYVGGGTPLILNAEQLVKVIGMVDDFFQVASNVDLCVEASPLTITGRSGRFKLNQLRQHGVTRVSFGVQSFDNAVLKAACRNYTADVAVAAARIVSEIFENWNIDLIQGLCKGSVDEIWTNLEAIAEIKPPHVTWYHGRYKSSLADGKRIVMARWQPEYESDENLLLGRLLIWQQMAALGYTQIDGNRFVREAKFIDPFKQVRTSATDDLIGFGPSAYSHVHDGFFRNECDVAKWSGRVLCGHATTIATGLPFTDVERLAATYVVGLRSTRVVTDVTRALEMSEPELAQHFAGLVGQLSALGLLASEHSGEFAFTSRGRLFEDEILALFFSPAVRARLGWT